MFTLAKWVFTPICWLADYIYSMTIEIKELAEVIVVFGPGVVAALLMCGLMVKVVKDLFSRQRS